MDYPLTINRYLKINIDKLLELYANAETLSYEVDDIFGIKFKIFAPNVDISFSIETRDDQYEPYILRLIIYNYDTIVSNIIDDETIEKMQDILKWNFVETNEMINLDDLFSFDVNSFIEAFSEYRDYFINNVKVVNALKLSYMLYSHIEFHLDIPSTSIDMKLKEGSIDSLHIDDAVMVRNININRGQYEDIVSIIRDITEHVYENRHEIKETKKKILERIANS